MFDGATSLSINIERKAEGAVLVSLKGRIDSDTYSKLDKEVKPILAPATKVLILDMSQVSYISSTGLAVIFQR